MMLNINKIYIQENFEAIKLYKIQMESKDIFSDKVKNLK